MNTNSSNSSVVTRFPPSPTGAMHIGNVRTMIYNYLYATQHQGVMIVRFEDTDKERSKREYEPYIINGLAWLGITDYSNPTRQSERTHIYTEYLKKLIADGFAYESTEEPKEANQRSSVIRFKNPNKTIIFNDVVRGEISVDTTDLGDFVIAKSLEEPIYHFAVVIDDYEGGITHVIRGEDHISNTPRQILIQQAIGASRPVYAHLPMVLGPDRSKLGKRHGSTSLQDLQDQGFLPAAVLNYLALLGWHPGGGDEQEIFTLNELIEKFDLSSVQKSGAIFSEEKLRWINKQHLDELSDGIFFAKVKEYLPATITSLPQYSDERLARLVPELRERITVYSEVVAMSDEGELEFYFDSPGYFAKDLVWKKADVDTTLKHLNWLQTTLQGTDLDKWDNPELLKEIIWPYAEQHGKGEVLWPLRFSLSGRERSPDPLSLLYILGRDESLQRIAKAIDLLSRDK